VYFLPWWALVACLAASALAAYLLLGRTRAGDSLWWLLPLTAVAAPVGLAGAMAAAVVLLTLLSALVEDRIEEHRDPQSEPPPRTDGGAEGRMARGTVKWFSEEKGYGFVSSD
jgi:lysylphosphatidylglycerol synthetase-like protein (DUF2156 family)